MEEYTIQQIQAVLNNPNDFPPKMVSGMLLAHCFTIEDLEKHGLDKQQSLKLKIALQAHEESEDYNKCQEPNAKYEDYQHFVDTYPNSVHYQDVKNKLDTLLIDKNKFDFLRKEVLDGNLQYSEKIARIQNFEKENPFSSFISEIPSLKSQVEAEETAHRKAAAEKARKEAAEVAAQAAKFAREQEDEREWQRILNILSNPAYMDRTEYKLQMLTDYENKYSLHLNEVPQKKKEIEADKNSMPQIKSVLENPLSDVIDFLRLIKKFPLKKDSIKNFMINDMKDNPSRYDREEMNWLLNGKFDDVDHISPIFTEDELLLNKIANREILKHIVTHPTDDSDRDPLEEELVPEENFKSQPNCTDVYFFGVPGSGKSTVLAGLFMVSKCDNLRFKILTHGGHLGFTYASILKNYLANNLFPQRTKVRFVAKQELAPAIQDVDNPFEDSEEGTQQEIIQQEELNSDKFIQIIDAELKEINPNTNLEESHRLSIIEMPGERTLDFAAADIRNPEEMDKLLGTGTRQLFMNNNRKVFFIVIDPKPERTYLVNTNGIKTPVTQIGALEALVQFFNEVPGLLEKIDAIHIILTKSDMLRNPNDIDCIKKDVIKRGYEGLISDIQELCKPSRGNVNAQCNHQLHLFTYSLGKVYPGHMIAYKDYDSKKILQLIAANTYSVRTTPTKWDTIVDWMNK